MKRYSLSHVSDPALADDLNRVNEAECVQTADLLAHIAEFDARQLYRPAGYDSMIAYCTDRLRRSDDAAYKRIRVARLAREYPVIFEAIADRRLHLTGVLMLGPHLTGANAAELLEASFNKTKAQIARLIAARFPISEVLPMVVAVPPGSQLAPERVGARSNSEAAAGELAPERVKVPAPIASGRYLLQISMGQEMRDELEYAQSLLSHQVSAGDVTAVLQRGLKLLIAQLEKRKFAATDRPRRSRPSTRARSIPAQVKREVWRRDGARCTFVGESGHRCDSRTRLEFDHVDPVARGGAATVEGMRLRCRVHNQYEAERVFGAGFMEEKRAMARAEASKRQDADLIAGLRELGFRMDECRRAAAATAAEHHGTLEQRMRAALRLLGPRARIERPSPQTTSAWTS